MRKPTIPSDCDYMTDAQTLSLLRKLHHYVSEFGSCSDMKLSEVAEDIAMSMEVTTDEADRLRVEICKIVEKGSN